MIVRLATIETVLEESNMKRRRKKPRSMTDGKWISGRERYLLRPEGFTAPSWT
jgi:hypothetical protein